MNDEVAIRRWAEVSQELSSAHANLQRANINLRSMSEHKAADDVLGVQEQVAKFRDDARAQRLALEGIPDGP